MKFTGPIRETLKQAGYKHVKAFGDGNHLLEDANGKQEIWFNSKRHAGYGILYKNTHLEFARSIPHDAAKARNDALRAEAKLRGAPFLMAD